MQLWKPHVPNGVADRHGNPFVTSIDVTGSCNRGATFPVNCLHLCVLNRQAR
jgi:hypothetical protein